MHHACIAFLILVGIAASAAGQVVIVNPPPPTYIDFPSLGASYGPCLSFGANGCVPNPDYRPDYTVGIYDPAAIINANAAAQQSTATSQALADLQAKVAALEAARAAELAGAGAVAVQQDRAKAALSQVIQAQNKLEAAYRATWPRWVQHWSKTGPSIIEAGERLRGDAEAGMVEHGCGFFVTFTEEAKIAMPPAPGNVMLGLHQALYDARQLCLADTKDGAAVAYGGERVAQEVRQLDSWAAGRSEYYSSVAP